MRAAKSLPSTCRKSRARIVPLRWERHATRNRPIQPIPMTCTFLLPSIARSSPWARESRTAGSYSWRQTARCRISLARGLFTRAGETLRSVRRAPPSHLRRSLASGASVNRPSSHRHRRTPKRFPADTAPTPSKSRLIAPKNLQYNRLTARRKFSVPPLTLASTAPKMTPASKLLDRMSYSRRSRRAPKSTPVRRRRRLTIRSVFTQTSLLWSSPRSLPQSRNAHQFR